MRDPRLLLTALLACAGVAAPAQERRNEFYDPFESATHGLTGCPVPEGPRLTEAQQKREALDRVERGTMCWRAKKCDELLVGTRGKPPYRTADSK
jgi:hypothetical protein